jgi:hypothetical protein
MVGLTFLKLRAHSAACLRTALRRASHAVPWNVRRASNFPPAVSCRAAAATKRQTLSHRGSSTGPASLAG